MLLLEEFYTSDNFVDWFTIKIEKPGAQLVHCTNSETDSNGESDLVLFFKIGESNLVVFIEDKIDAPLQPNQAERYKQRATNYSAGNKNSEAVTVIVAPQKYFQTEDNTFGFNYKITYEEIGKWFKDSQDSQSRRVDFKRECIQRAIKKSINGWVMIPDKAVTNFWKAYWEKAESFAPALKMKEPRDKPARSRTINFKPWTEKNVKIVHQLLCGYVDLRFIGEYDKDENFQNFTDIYKEILPTGASIQKAGKKKRQSESM